MNKEEILTLAIREEYLDLLNTGINKWQLVSEEETEAHKALKKAIIEYRKILLEILKNNIDITV